MAPTILWQHGPEQSTQAITPLIDQLSSPKQCHPITSVYSAGSKLMGLHQNMPSQGLIINMTQSRGRTLCFTYSWLFPTFRHTINQRLNKEQISMSL